MDAGVTLTVAEALALMAAMAVLAAVPSTSVLAVVARASSSGFAQGAATAMGVVAGDIVFIVIALFGLAVLIDAMGPLFIVLRAAAAVYLVLLAVRLWRSAGKAFDVRAGEARPLSLAGSFGSGLLITLGDQKAVFFYLGFLPAFVSLERVTLADAGLLIAVAVVAVGGVKLAYAALADRVAQRLGGSGTVMVQRTAAVVLCLTAVLVLVRA